MKILRIKFQNLNSLPEGDINLEHGPIAAAGIFAITGPTGAGKSTILDAITLALYGRAARYDKEANPLDMMSRHTGSSQAEVLFEVKGERYRAEWQLRRARGKSDGKPQPPVRRLYDAENRPLAQNIRETDALVEEITGLDYERFLRSVLLAQGQFAQFLKATDSQRAELLEQITGTTIYSELSILAFTEAGERERALQEKRNSLGFIPLLEESEIATAKAEIEQSDLRLKEIAGQQSVLEKRIEAGRHLRTYQNTLQGIHEAAARLVVKKEEFRASQALLERHQEASRFFSPLQILIDLQSREAVERTAAEEARSAEAEAKRDFLALVQSALNLAHSLQAEAHTTLQNTAAEKKQLQTTLEATEAWLSQQAHLLPLEKQLPQWVEDLTNLTTLRGQETKLAEEIKALAKTLEEVAAEKERLTFAAQKAALHEKSREGILQEHDNRLKKLLGGKDSAYFEQSKKTLEERWKEIFKLQGILEKREADAKEAVEISDQEGKLTEDLKLAHDQKKATDQEALNQRKVLETVEKALKHLEKIAGYEAQRALLESGQECPLCGSKEHPYIHGDEILSRDIEEAQRNCLQAEMANETARKEAELAGGEIVRIEEALRQLEKRRADLREVHMSSHGAYETLARKLRLFTPESVVSALEENEQKRAELECLLETLRTVEANRAEAQNEFTKAQAATTQAGERLQNQQTRQHETEGRLQKAQEQAVNVSKEIEGLSNAISLNLAPLSLSLPLPGAEIATRRTLESWIEALQEKTRLREQQTRRLADLDHRLARQGGDVAEIQKRIETLTSLPQQHQLCLGNLHPDPVRMAFYEGERRSLEDFETDISDRQHGIISLATALSERTKRADELLKAKVQHRGALNLLLQGSPFQAEESAPERLLLEAKLPESRLEALEREAKALAEEERQIAVQTAQIQQQIAALESPPEAELLLSLEAEKKCLDEELIPWVERRSRAAQALENDHSNRLKREAFGKELQLQEEQFKIWSHLRQLIGSHDGKRFSRFAQGLTLDLLVRHANRHLANLSDRYLLQRGASGELTLEVTDLHQASTTRPMQSLSGGESFLMSLALALGLSDLAGRNTRIDSLFIDEGFGTLDAETLDLAMSALETLRMSQKTIGVISHIDLLKERIPVQIRVIKKSGGVSELLLPGTLSA